MKKKRIIKYTIIFLLIVELGVSFLMYKSAMNKNINLSDVKLTKLNNNDMFTIMLQEGEEYIPGEWPTEGYNLNMEKSGCIDGNGKNLNAELSYNNVDQTISLKATGASKCYLYFDEVTTDVKIDTLVESLHIKNANLAVEELKNFYGDESEDYVNNKSLGYYDLAKITLTPLKEGEDNNIYTCNTTLNVTLDTTSANNMGSVLKEGDAVLHIFVNGHNTDYDLSKIRDEGGSKSIDIEIETVGSNDKNIRGYLELHNNKGDNQTHLANKNLQVNISTGDISCVKTGKAVEANKEEVKNFISDNATSKTQILFVDNIDTEGGTNIQDLSLAKDESIKGWIKDSTIYIGANKSKIIIKDMSSMFDECKASSIDLSNVTFDRTTDMSRMFYSAGYLTEIVFPNNIDTSNVTNMSYMFSGLYNSAQLDLSNFDTSNVTNMSFMLGNGGARNVILTNFDTSNVTNMDGMFSTNGFNQESIDLSSFDFSKAYESGTLNQLFAQSSASSSFIIIVADETQRTFLTDSYATDGITIKIAAEV